MVNKIVSKFGTALQAAAWGGDIRNLGCLLAQVAEVNAQGSKYRTALQAACSTFQIPVPAPSSTTAELS